MEAIFASKFYKASKRQDSIKAALTDPINHELVQQLSEYIGDDEWKRVKEITEPEESAVKSVPKEQVSEESADTDNASTGGTSAPATHSAPHRVDHHLSDMLKEEEGADVGIPSESGGESSEQESTSEESITVSESTNVEDTTISGVEFDNNTASASLLNIHACDDIPSQIDSIAGLLNADVETTGVRRCVVKSENELWIYYNDSINLNNVMEPVISLLNASDYGYLDFNRLARTDNAIVFSISETPKTVEPVQESDE